MQVETLTQAFFPIVLQRVLVRRLFIPRPVQPVVIDLLCRHYAPLMPDQFVDDVNFVA